MTNWTPEAEKFLEDYLQQIKELANKKGDDGDDIVEGVKDHIFRELETTGVSFITEDAVHRITAKIGTPEEIAGEASAKVKNNPSYEKTERWKSKAKKARHIVFWIFAIILPVVSVFYELATHMMAQFYFDPMPGWAFFFILLLVPISYYIALRIITKEQLSDPRFASLALIMSAYAATVSIIYMIVYLPTTPLAMMGIIVFGFGLIGLSPLTCGIGGIVQTRSLYRKIKESNISRKWALKRSFIGAVIALLLLGVAEIPYFFTDRALEMAVGENEREKKIGVWWIEHIFGEKELLRVCYGGFLTRGPFREFRAASKNLEEYRKLYYQLNGKSFNSAPRPKPRNANLDRNFEPWDELMIEDGEIGGDEVAGLVKGLSLYSSAIDISIAGDKNGSVGPGLGYIEWAMEFKNDSNWKREARAEIALPHDAVVSRLTLWINGEERDSAFGGRSQTKEAYKEVATVRRDPALVTTTRPDYVMLQCFPIEPHKTMKVKIGVTAPLIFRDKAYLTLPYFSERNFIIPKNFVHNLWADSKVELKDSADVKVEHPSANVYTIRGKISDNSLHNPSKAILLLNAPANAGVPYVGALGSVSATMTIKPFDKISDSPQKIMLVVDGSRSMKNADIKWRPFLSSLPSSAQINAIFAGDSVERWKDTSVAVSPSAIDDLTNWLTEKQYVRGRDPVPALEKAIEMALTDKNAAIIWIHGPLPIELSSSEGISQWLRRRPIKTGENKIKFLSLAAAPGPNKLEQKIGYESGMETVPIIESINDTLIYIAKNLQASDFTREYDISTSEAKAFNTNQDVKNDSSHIVRLAVASKVKDLLGSKDQNQIDFATKLAVATRLVTPFTGAVVLESKEQYERHDLDPTASPEAIPVIPEPEEWMLIIVVVLALLFIAYRQWKIRPGRECV